MKCLHEATRAIKRVLTEQAVDKTKKYRKIFYLAEVPHEDGLILYNTVTFESLILDWQEAKLLENPTEFNEVTEYLIKHYFLVPENFNDKEFASQISDFSVNLSYIYDYTTPLRYFVVLPTTGCNARCFYCFERGAKGTVMSQKTAHDVADFIKRKSKGEQVHIRWFGGEPLMNTRAIDIISEDLASTGTDFDSSMISNGYLFDKDLVQKAIDEWRLKRIQITLDGTEEVYNRVKDYVYSGVPSPFYRVLDNIEMLLKTGVLVLVRLNMDDHNADDLFELAKQLVARFNKYDNASIYVTRIFENTCDRIKNREASERHAIIKKASELQAYIDANMPKRKIGMAEANVGYERRGCMASSDTATMIVPDGHLGKCEHFIDSDFYGSIYDDNYDVDNIIRHKKMVSHGPQCEGCKHQFGCLHLECCTGVSRKCDDVDKKVWEDYLASRLKNYYGVFKRNEAEQQ